MTIARSLQINLKSTSYYHCISRCVRRSYLCGRDLETNQDFSHRKEWIVAKLKQLSNIFAIKICAYAVMSNHYHVVLYVNEHITKIWSDDEIRRRWGKLFYKDAKHWDTLPHLSKEKIEKTIAWRKRLADISWFMRCLNEYIARLSNQEDKCTGRFWEGRFKCQALLDEGALLSAMVYVDLNPIRAKEALTPEDSRYTSIYERIHYARKQLAVSLPHHKEDHAQRLQNQFDEAEQPPTLYPLKTSINGYSPRIAFSLSDYINLVDEAGRIVQYGKRGAIPENLKPIFQRLNLRYRYWQDLLIELENKFSYAIGHVKRLVEHMRSAKQRAPKGSSFAACCYEDFEENLSEQDLRSNSNVKID